MTNNTLTKSHNSSKETVNMQLKLWVFIILQLFLPPQINQIKILELKWFWTKLPSVLCNWGFVIAYAKKRERKKREHIGKTTLVSGWNEMKINNDRLQFALSTSQYLFKIKQRATILSIFTHRIFITEAPLSDWDNFRRKKCQNRTFSKQT